MIQLLNQGLAYVFDMLKSRSPVIATIVLSILGALHMFVTSDAASLEVMPEWFKEVAKWVTFVFIALGGSRTSRYVNSSNTQSIHDGTSYR